MFSFFINLSRFIKIIFHGLKEDAEFRFLFFFIIVLLIGSTCFYVRFEQWSAIDSLYFSVMTMATIGYGDLIPTKDFTKIFTIIYTFLSIGGFVAFTTKSVQILLKNHQEKTSKLRQKIEQRMENKTDY